jgi:hypothetical protein
MPLINLPFELNFASPHEAFPWGGTSIPKYGSLTPNEAIALAAIELDVSRSIYWYYAEVGNVLLRSRTNLREYTLQELLDSVPCKDLEDLFHFTIGECRQWQPEEEEKTPKGELIGLKSTGGFS